MPSDLEVAPVDVSLLAWGAVLIAILAMLAVDLFLHRDAHEIPVREAATWSAIWVAIGVLAGGVIWAVYGAEFGQQYFAGYVIEKSLAVDNVFVWAIIFSYFAVPRQYQHRVLFYGVLGALVFRAIFIAAGLRADRVVRLGALRLRRPSWSGRAGRCGAPATPTSTRRNPRSSRGGAAGCRRPTSTTARSSGSVTNGKRLGDPASARPRDDRGHRHHLRRRLDPGRSSR